MNDNKSKYNKNTKVILTNVERMIPILPQWFIYGYPAVLNSIYSPSKYPKHFPLRINGQLNGRKICSHLIKSMK